MIRIMILDDEAIYLEKERKITHSFFARKGIEHRIEVFQSWEWFIAGLKEERFDLYILDIEMSGKMVWKWQEKFAGIMQIQQ